MSKELIKQEVAHLLETITEQAEIIYQHEHKIPQIEMDIMLGNVRNLYEQLLALNKSGQVVMPSVNEVPKPETGSKTVVAETITKEVKTAQPEKQVEAIITPMPEVPIAPNKQESITEQIEIVAAIAEPEILFEPEKQESIVEKIEIAAVVAEPEIPVVIPKVVQPVVELPTVATPIEQPEPEVKVSPKVNIQEQIVVQAAVIQEKHETEKAVRQKPKTAASLFDAPQSFGAQFDDSQSLKEKISAAKPEKSIVDKFSNQQKIVDLKKSIGINEKFLFINELFEGSLASYNEHIDKINASSESNHALSIVDSLVSKYNWNTDQDIVKKFMDLVHRRFL